MVQTDIDQLVRECTNWREQLRQQKQALLQLRDELQQSVHPDMPRESLTEVEHFHNQFHIQLINVHDLKQSIKIHERKVQLETATGGSPSEETLRRHEELHDEFLRELSLLQELEQDFHHFLPHA